MKNNLTIIGLIAGIALGFAIIFGGLSGFLWVLLFGIVGTLLGAQIDGRINLAEVFNVRNGRE